MREGGPTNDEPLIAKWHQGEHIKSDYLGEGVQSEVHREAYLTESGPEVYALKDDLDEPEVRRALDIYQKLRAAGLPVVSFLKTRYSKNELGNSRTGIVMEDATHNGQYELAPMYDGKGLYGTNLLSRCKEVPQLMMNTVRALAVMHNNQIYDFHPGLSFFFRREVEHPENVDFILLDYSNMTTSDKQKIHKGDGVFVDREPALDPEIEYSRDLKVLMDSFPRDNDFEAKILAYYDLVRKQGVKTYVT